MIGRVVSTKMQKTVTVIVESRKTHPLYKKTYRWSKKYLAHDEKEAQMGDIVQIIKCRPISKRKHWLVTKVLGKDIVPMSEEALKAEAEIAIAQVMPEEKETAEKDIQDVQVKAEVTEAPKKSAVKKVTKAKAISTKKTVDNTVKAKVKKEGKKKDQE